MTVAIHFKDAKCAISVFAMIVISHVRGAVILCATNVLFGTMMVSIIRQVATFVLPNTDKNDRHCQCSALNYIQHHLIMSNAEQPA